MSGNAWRWVSGGLIAASIIGTSIAAPPSPEVRARWAPGASDAPLAVRDWMRETLTRSEQEAPGRLLGFHRAGGEAGARDAIYCAFIFNEGGTPVVDECISADQRQPRTLTEIGQQRRAEAWAARGVASSQMLRRMDEADEDERLEVMVWARTARVDREAVMTGRTTIGDLKRAQTLRNDRVFALCRSLARCEVYRVAGPMMKLIAPPASLRQMQWDKALAVMEPWPNEAQQDGPNAYLALEGMGFDVAQALPYGATGAGVDIAVFEGGQPYESTHPIFAAYWNPSDTHCRSTPEGYHAQAVMSMIGADANLGQSFVGRRALDGAAPGARMLLATTSGRCNFDGKVCLFDIQCTNGCDQNIGRCRRSACLTSAHCSAEEECKDLLCIPLYPQRLDDAAVWAADRITESWPWKAVYNLSSGPKHWADPRIPCVGSASTSYGSISRYFDWLALNPPYPVVLSSAGNKGWARTVGNQNHNGLVVGAADSLGDGDPSNDIMWDVQDCTVTELVQGVGTQTRNPGDLELPHVVAAADGIILNGADDWWRASGPATSWAAPRVAGLAAAIMDGQLGSHADVLDTYPEAVKAIILATARIDVDGHAFDLLDGWDDRDGAGLIDAELAVELVQQGAYNSWNTPSAPMGFNAGLLRVSDFSGSVLPDRVETGPLPTGTLKVAMTWNVDPGCSSAATCNSTSAPDWLLRLGLWIYRKSPEGIWTLVDVGFAPNPVQNHLVVKVSGQPGDEYQIRIIKLAASSTDASAYYGLAWTHF